MPSKIMTATGYKNIIDRKVSNGDVTFRNIGRTVVKQAGGTFKTVWTKQGTEVFETVGLVCTGAQYIDTGIIGSSIASTNMIYQYSAGAGNNLYWGYGKASSIISKPAWPAETIVTLDAEGVSGSTINGSITLCLTARNH
jgi:hypothetical protein